MRFYWVKDRVKQGQFKIYWEPGRNKKADYFTKHHLLDHHIKVRHEYLNNALTLINSTLQGCVNLSPVSKGSNPDIENRDNGQSTMYSSAMPLPIEQVYAVEDDPLPTLPATEIKRIQGVVGCLLYYAR